MRTIIRRKSDNVNVGVVQENTTFEWQIEHNVIPNFGGDINDYDVIKEKTWLDAFKETPEYKKQVIQNELKQLDTALIDPRLIEDLVEKNPIKKEKLDIIARKKALRQQLQELGV